MAFEIHKLQLILEKLNFLNDEKQHRIAEIEELFGIKKQDKAGGKGGGSKPYDPLSSDRAPDLATSYFISQQIISSVKEAAESVYDNLDQPAEVEQDDEGDMETSETINASSASNNHLPQSGQGPNQHN